MTKDRKEQNDPVIPTNPTANITDSMRVEAKQHSPEPEVFENKSSSPSPPPSHSKTDVAGPPSASLQAKSQASTLATETQKLAREPDVKYTMDKDTILDFQGDVLSVYSQSSGTFSYDDAVQITHAALENVKNQAMQVLWKDPEMFCANEVDLLGAASQSRQPSIESYSRAKFDQVIFADKCPGPHFEQVVQPVSKPKSHGKLPIQKPSQGACDKVVVSVPEPQPSSSQKSLPATDSLFKSPSERECTPAKLPSIEKSVPGAISPRGADAIQTPSGLRIIKTESSIEIKTEHKITLFSDQPSAKEGATTPSIRACLVVFLFVFMTSMLVTLAIGITLAFSL